MARHNLRQLMGRVPAGEVPATVTAVALPEIAVDELRMLSRVQSMINFAAVETLAIDAKNKLVGFPMILLPTKH